MSEEGKSEKTLLLIHRGVFFQADEECAIVLHNITRYKLKQRQNDKIFCGFPDKVIDKVLQQIEQACVSYRVLWDHEASVNGVYRGKDFDCNQYGKYAVLEDGDAPEPVTKIAEKGAGQRGPAADPVVTEQMERAIAYLDWLCTTARQGVRCTIDLSDPVACTNFLELQQCMDQLLEDRGKKKRKNRKERVAPVPGGGAVNEEVNGRVVS